jgi:hypothetical protein
VKQTKLNLNEIDFAYLAVLTSWNIEARYPDYKQKVHKTATAEYVKQALIKTEKIKIWMLNKLQ